MYLHTLSPSFKNVIIVSAERTLEQGQVERGSCPEFLTVGTHSAKTERRTPWKSERRQERRTCFMMADSDQHIQKRIDPAQQRLTRGNEKAPSSPRSSPLRDFPLRLFHHFHVFFFLTARAESKWQTKSFNRTKRLALRGATHHTLVHEVLVSASRVSNFRQELENESLESFDAVDHRLSLGGSGSLKVRSSMSSNRHSFTVRSTWTTPLRWSGEI